MPAKRPSKAQVAALAWAIHYGGGMLRSHETVLTISDATVVAMVVAGWAERARFYDDVRQWRWWWFYVTDAARAQPAVVAEVARLKAWDDARAQRWNAADDAQDE